jgi:Protein of unknown function (DUF2789)
VENHIHSDAELFDQLGLESTEIDIKFFIQIHRPLDSQIKLSDAPFWSETQAKFLRDQLISDADWTAVIDKLNISLRE